MTAHVSCDSTQSLRSTEIKYSYTLTKRLTLQSRPVMLDHVIYGLSRALARTGASVGAFPNRPLIGSQLRHCQFWYVTFYGYIPNPFSFSSETVNT